MKRVSLKQVACCEYKSDIAKIAARLSGTEAGELGDLAVFQAAINKLMDTLDEDDIAKLEETQANWLSQGQLCKLKRKATEKMGQHYLQECAKVQFNNFGM